MKNSQPEADRPLDENSQRGFTLIELLASTVVIITVGLIVVSIIVSSLRGVNKINTINTAQQNGNATISQIAKTLRFARSLDAIDGNTNLNCIPTNPVAWPTPQPTLTPHTSLTVTNIDGGQTTLACLGSTIASTSGSLTQSLLDTSLVSIPAGMCKITCNQTTLSDSVIININFSLTTVKPAGITQLLPEFTMSSGAIEFNTSVILRNTAK